MTYQYRREPLLTDEATSLSEVCRSGKERLIVWTFLDAGLRVSELTGLRRQDIDFQIHRLRVHGKGGDNGSRSKLRVIPMSPRIRPLIEGFYALEDSLGIGDRAVQLMIKRIASRAGISRPVCPHVLRHTFACTCLQRGISLPVIQKLLGHELLSTTQVYLNISPEDVCREFLERF